MGHVFSAFTITLCRGKYKFVECSLLILFSCYYRLVFCFFHILSGFKIYFRNTFFTYISFLSCSVKENDTISDVSSKTLLAIRCITIISYYSM